MNGNLLVLVVGKEVAKALRNAKTLHFRSTGDSSVYLLPEVLILGRWNRKRFDRRTLHLELEFSNKAEKTEHGYLLPVVDSTGLEALKKELGIEDTASGLYVSRDIEPEELLVPHSSVQKIAMLTDEGEGYILLQ